LVAGGYVRGGRVAVGNPGCGFVELDRMDFRGGFVIIVLDFAGHAGELSDVGCRSVSDVGFAAHRCFVAAYGETFWRTRGGSGRHSEIVSQNENVENLAMFADLEMTMLARMLKVLKKAALDGLGRTICDFDVNLTDSESPKTPLSRIARLK
jgi:hypothetical protein